MWLLAPDSGVAIFAESISVSQVIRRPVLSHRREEYVAFSLGILQVPRRTTDAGKISVAPEIPFRPHHPVDRIVRLS